VTKYLAIGVGVLLLALGVSGWLLKRAWAENGALETRLKSAQAIIDQREQDQRDNARVIAQLSQKLSDTETKVVTVTERIYSAPKTEVCRATPAIRAAIDGVRDIYAPALQAPGGREPAATVPGPGPAVGRPQR
jgi:hypothetical protein